jgi:hypothetical protein
MEAAVERGCFLELNAQPERLGLSAVYSQRAKELGLQLAIGTDAHWESGLDVLPDGTDQGTPHPGHRRRARASQSERAAPRNSPLQCGDFSC